LAGKAEEPRKEFYPGFLVLPANDAERLATADVFASNCALRWTPMELCGESPCKKKVSLMQNN
jgi:hypothetical protein